MYKDVRANRVLGDIVWTNILVIMIENELAMITGMRTRLMRTWRSACGRHVVGMLWGAWHYDVWQACARHMPNMGDALRVPGKAWQRAVYSVQHQRSAESTNPCLCAHMATQSNLHAHVHAHARTRPPD